MFTFLNVPVPQLGTPGTRSIWRQKSTGFHIHPTLQDMLSSIDMENPAFVDHFPTGKQPGNFHVGSFIFHTFP
jgi:hypothetical protein